jgi:hypothetical protein
MRGKTIQVFLTDGSPRGIKLAEITSNIELAVLFRSRVSQLSQVGRVDTASMLMSAS